MENSFYYFFSATPQVLGGIMALFGVFVIFKIQALTTELLAEAEKLDNVLRYHSEKKESNEHYNLRMEMQEALSSAIQGHFVKKIYYIIEKYSDVILQKKAEYLMLVDRCSNISSIHKNLISETINSSIITGITIVLCLAILPFGKLIICHTVLLYCIFAIVVISIAIIFYKLYLVLKKSFE